MNDIRRHYFLDRWVIISSLRAKRPEELPQNKEFEIREVHVHNKRCPFDRQNLKAPILHKVGEPWEIAVIQNKFPAVDPNTPLVVREGFFKSRGGFGMHEVIIEHPDHIGFENFSDEHVKKLIEVYAQRTRAHMSDDKIKYVSIFRNFGADAGASIVHPHSQVIALPEVPRAIYRERGKMDEFFHMFGENPFETIYREEKKEGERFLFETPDFFVVAPFASVFPGETWVIPKRHIKTLMELRKNETGGLAVTLKKTIRTMMKIFPGMSYNIAFHQAPRGRDFWMHVEIYPRLSKFAGFELSNDMYINVMPPETYAGEFKGAMV